MAEIYHVTADKCLEFSGLKCDARLKAKPFILFSCVCGEATGCCGFGVSFMCVKVSVSADFSAAFEHLCK